MQASIEGSSVKTKKDSNTSSSTDEMSACESLTDKLLAEYEEEQRAIKELDELLEPTIIAINNGEVSVKSFDEIVKEGKEKAKRRLR